MLLHDASFASLFQKILSVVFIGNKLGAAYYDVETSVLYIMKDIIEQGIRFKTLKEGESCISFET